MTFGLDVKSVVVGLVVGAVVVFSLGAGVNLEPQVKRYAIAGNEGHAFVLDTVTGQVWEKFTPANSANPVNSTIETFAGAKLQGVK